MSVQPYKILDRRGTGAGRSYFDSRQYGFTEAAKTSNKREQRSSLDRDAHALIPARDRKALMTIGRALFQNSSLVSGAIGQMAQLATATIIPQFDGSDKTWGIQAESWLLDNDRWINVRGENFCMTETDRLIVLHIIRDGDVGLLLTEDQAATPKVQLISGHRIGCRNQDEETVVGGPFDGARCIDGVICGPSLEPLGYRVLGATQADDRDYSANDFKLIFRPQWGDQIRGYSWLGQSIVDILDVHEFRRLELIAQKVLSGRTLIEHTETGTVDDGLGEIITAGSEATSTSAAQAPIYGREIQAGETTIFRAGSQSKLEVVRSDRPTANQQTFSADTIRQAIHGIGWSVDFALDPSKVGGASMRVVVDGVINPTLDMIRDKIVSRYRGPLDAWRIAKAVKNGRLPFNDEWWRWTFQFAQRITADRKYDSDVDVNELRAGIRTFREVCARRGAWWQDVIEQKAAEARTQLSAAKALSAEFSIPLEKALDMIAMLTPNGSASAPAAAPDTQSNEAPPSN